MAFSIVEKKSSARGNAIDQQIQITITIDIGEGGAGRKLSSARCCSYIHFFKAPIAKIAIEPVGALQTAKVNVRPSISVHIADRHPGTIVCNSVGQIGIALEHIRKPDSGLVWLHQSKARPA